MFRCAFKVTYSLAVRRGCRSRTILSMLFSSQSLQQNEMLNAGQGTDQNKKMIQQRKVHPDKFQHGKLRPKQTRSDKIISTEWVQVTNIPPLSTLDDLLPDVERIMNVELSMGIVDLDAAEQIIKQHDPVDAADISPQLPLWKPKSSLPPHLVMEARVMLSTLKRQQGWYLKFPNRSVVHALLSHLDQARQIEARQTRGKWQAIQENKIRQKSSISKDAADEESQQQDEKLIVEGSENNLQIRPLMCAWQKVKVSPYYVGRSSGGNIDSFFMEGLKYKLGDNVLRVENCARETTIDDVKYFFKRYTLYDERQNAVDKIRSVELVVRGEETIPKGAKDTKTPSMTNSFLVRFASSADARAALTEKQNVALLGRKIRLARYSRQILDHC
jgi:hypothetical protein